MSQLKGFSLNKKSNGFLKISIIAVALLFLVLVLNLFISPIKNIFFGVSSPVQKNFWSASVSSSSFLGSFFQGYNLAKENEYLRSQNNRLLAQVSLLQSIEQGNVAQTNVSTVCQNAGYKVMMAGVVGLDDNDMLSINKGSADGIAEGMPVINQENVLFGKVFKVYKNFSQIMLISNKNSVVNVKVFQLVGESDVSQEIDGVIRGTGSLGAYLDLIPVDATINPNDIMITSSIEKSFPKDLLVGKIVKTQKNDQKPFQNAEISLFANVKTADNLFVITNYKQKTR